MQALGPDDWIAINRSLDRALELSAEKRTEWVARLAAESPELAAKLTAMLAAREHPDFGRFLSGNATILPAAPGAAGLAGQRVGAYVLDSELGRGGMGTVWLAHRADGQYEARVAIKFLAAVWSGSKGQERFRREGQLLARLDHPHIARLLDAGVMDGTQPYLVLEYVEGERIDRHCESGRLDVAARLALFLDVLSAVSHAHRHLIIHRDIKPANVLVTAGGEVKLLDFGIARLVSDAAAAPTLAVGHAMTPEFAAPEQLRGEPVTTATDVYSLGLVLYVLLTGRHPFADALHAPADLVKHALETEPRRPSTAVTAGPLRGALRGDLDNIVAKALRKDPSQRYASADAFAEDLRRFLDQRPVSARADTPAYRLAKFVRRNRGAVATGSTLILTLLVATVVTTMQLLEARRQRDEAQFQSRRAESANEFLNLLLMSDGGPDRPPLSGAERVERGVQMLERQYGEDPRFAGRMLVQLGRQFRGVMDTRRAVEIFTRAYELGGGAGDLELMVLAQCAAAYAEALAQANARVGDRLAEARGLMARIPRPGVALRIDCMQAEAQAALQVGDDSQAIARLLDARRLIESTGNSHRAFYTTILTDLGGVYLGRNQLREALQMAELVGETHERYGRGDTAARLIALQNRAVVLDNMGEMREALAQREEINRRVRILEPAAAEPFAYSVNHALVLIEMARPEEALRALDGVVERTRRADNQAWLMRALYASGLAYMHLGRRAEATAALDEAGLIAGRNPEVNRDFMLRIERCRSEIELAGGEISAARRRIEFALAASGHPRATPTRQVADALVTAADIALRDARPADAEVYARIALEAAEAVARGSETSADVGKALLRIARAKTALGKPDEARTLVERAVRCLENGLGSEHPLTDEAHAARAAMSG